MLVFEDSAGQSLYLGRAVPRAWLASSEPVGIGAAPTRWGRTGFQLQAAKDGTIRGSVSLPDRDAPAAVWLSLRLPAGKRLIEATWDGHPITADDRRDDAVRLRGVPGQSIEVHARYA
jgi:hypothetical protein